MSDTNYLHVTTVKYNLVTWSKLQLSLRDKTPDTKIVAEKQNQLHIHNGATVSI